MRSSKRLTFAGVLCVVTIVLAACDNSPDPNFEKVVKDQQAARAGDPYVQLNSTPRQYRYARSQPGQRKAAVGQDSLSFRSNYESMLEKLDSEPKVAGIDALAASCRKGFAEASAFQDDDNSDAASVTRAGKEIFEQLRACRDEAIRAGDAQDATSAVRDRAATLRRFASSGMVLVASWTVARGDDAAGLAMWKEGDELAAEDKPGFTLTPDSFRQ